MYVNQGWYFKEKLLEDASNSIGYRVKELSAETTSVRYKRVTYNMYTHSLMW